MDQLPRYRLIYELLRKNIAEGRFPAGDMLPSENELCREHSVTRPTVRKALDMLTSDGFIVRQQGKGSIVKGSPKGIGILSLSSTTSATEGDELHTRIITPPHIREWDQEAFSFPITQAENQAGCIYFERLRILGGEPVILDITMLPNTGLPRFTSYDMEDISLFDLLRSKYKITVVGGTQQLFAISADRRLHNLMGVRQGYPILQLNRRIDTDREGFSFYSQIFCVTNKYGLIGTF